MNAKKVLMGVLILTGLVFAAQGLANDIKFTALKPASSQALSDEQQGILAVRTAKASVVNILGMSKPVSPASSTAVNISVNPSAGTVSGTGFIIDSSGLVVTNNHVVDDNSLVYFVIFSDGTQYPATIFGHDSYDDIALLKIDAQGLTAAKLGDSDSLETGQTVFAIGNSLGKYQNTVTRGVVSGLGRGINETSGAGTPTTHNWIQTDAAINLGNSGGPLINMLGEVVGMNTLIDPQGTGLGFAVSVNTIKDAVNQLKVFGKVSRPFLGVVFTTIDPAFQKQQGLQVSKGAWISKVLDQTPAAQAGLQVYDIVTAVNGQQITTEHPLDAIVQKFQAGNQVTFSVLRGSQQIDLPVVLGQVP